MATSPPTATTASAKSMMDDEYSVLSVSTIKVSNSIATRMSRYMEFDIPEVLRAFIVEISKTNAELRREAAQLDREAAQLDREAAQRDREAAQLRREFAERDAQRDREFAERDREFAERDAQRDREVAQLRRQIAELQVAQRDAQAGQFQEGGAVEGLVTVAAPPAGDILGWGVADQGVVGTGFTPLPEAVAPIAMPAVKTDSEESEAVASISKLTVKTDSEKSEAVPFTEVTFKSASEELEEVSAMTLSSGLVLLPGEKASVGSASQTAPLVASIPVSGTDASLATIDVSSAGEKGSNE